MKENPMVYRAFCRECNHVVMMTMSSCPDAHREVASAIKRGCKIDTCDVETARASEFGHAEGCSRKK